MDHSSLVFNDTDGKYTARQANGANQMIKMAAEFPIGSTITETVAPIGASTAALFTAATRSTHSTTFIPALATVFRLTEFKWLDRLQVDWHNLLHAEQQYEYHCPLPLDKPFTVESRLCSVRVRKSSTGSMTFVELDTRITADTLCVCALTSFVVREAK